MSAVLGIVAPLWAQREGKLSRPLDGLAARFARTHGPFDSEEAACTLGVGVALAAESLERLAAEGRLVRWGPTAGPMAPCSPACAADPSPGPARRCALFPPTPMCASCWIVRTSRAPVSRRLRASTGWPRSSRSSRARPFPWNSGRERCCPRVCPTFGLPCWTSSSPPARCCGRPLLWGGASHLVLPDGLAPGAAAR
ncbi:MAG: hypothetical protein ACLTDR_16155 [Adlercreutzia equolifaciens]